MYICTCNLLFISIETCGEHYKYCTSLTGSPTVITPYSFTVLGWWNCLLMVASCKNLTFSSSAAESFNVLIATSLVPLGELHTPLSTVPKLPDPWCPYSVLVRDVDGWVQWYKLITVVLGSYKSMDGEETVHW